MAADDAERLCDIEFDKLTQRLHRNLKNDIARIFTDSLFSDLELVLGNISLHVNCCVLQVRTKSFYNQLCFLQKSFSSGCELDIEVVDKIQTLIRDIYEQDNIKSAETLVVKYLKDIAASPDFELYATPLTSPLSVTGTGLDLKPDPSYYSIVPLDWDKELAEQDFLIESFRSIIRKEQLKTRLRPRKSFSSCRRDTRSLLDLKKAVEEDSILLQEEGFLCSPYVSGSRSYIKPSLQSDLKKVKCRIIHHIDESSLESCNECGFFDAEDSSGPFNSSLNDMPRGISEKSKMSSNIDTGPDSGLATSAEDIPLDQESGLEVSKSIWSSVSSDCCGWDSSSAPQQHHDLNLWVDNAPHQDNSSVQPDFVDRVLEELVGKSKAQNHDHVSSDLASINMPKHHFFIDASSLLDETEMQALSLEAAHESDHTKTQEVQCFTEEDGVASSVTQNMVRSDVANIHCYEDLDDVDGKAISEIHVSNTSRGNTGNDKPPSLIRSNTFELETEDDRLALLRQEYEKRQGSLIFQRCGSQSSGPLSDGGQDLNQHCTSLILPDLDQSQVNSLMFPAHIVDEEIQTPDSLNSDMLETGCQEKCTSNTKDFQHILPEVRDLIDTEKRDGPESLPWNSTSSDNEVSSPLFTRRETEGVAILSGAAPALLLSEQKPEKKSIRAPLTSSLSAAWVVDISDIRNSPESRRKVEDLSFCEVQGEQASMEPKSLTSSLGYFIDLNDPRQGMKDKCDSIQSSEGRKISRQSSDSGKVEKQNACEFFVDLNHPTDDLSKSSEATASSEKKLFSMFIDIGDKVRPRAKPDLTSRIRAPLSPFSTKKKNPMSSNTSQQEGINGKSINSDSEGKGSSQKSDKTSTLQSKLPTLTSDHKKGTFFMFIESESASGNQKSPLSSRSNAGNSFSNGKEKAKPKIQHVRAHSVSSVKKCVGTSTSSALSSSSKHLSSQSLQSAEMFSDNDEVKTKPMFSSYHASLPLEESHEGKLHQSQVEMVETSELSSVITGSNHSSACSLETYSVHTPEQSSAADDFSSEKKDLLQNYDSVEDKQVHADLSETVNISSVNKTTRGKIPSISENNLNSDKNTKSFVRLSDLDKEPVSASDRSAPSIAHRMSRSIPETSWIERKSLMSQSTGGGSGVMSSSSRSLSRLFPHLSMCSVGRSKTSSTCSPLNEDLDTMRSSQISDISSMQSSAGLEYSTESTDISSDRGSPATQLGDDLLKMFLEEINTDVIVEVGGRRIKAHKCILSSRCQYFAAILSGGWVESAGNVISLQGFSYTVVHFALCHIYSGASTIPDQISIVELASLADMLSLEGLKDVIMYTLKVKYCHFFHKPCAVCSVGVLECLPLAAAYGLDDIYRKSLRWITKYFVRIWPTKTFTTLPRELIEKCYQQHVIHMTAENVLETILCCDKLLSTIPTVRWAEPVFVLTSRLMEMCIKFMSENLCSVLVSDNFLALGREVPWNVSRFQESLVSACERMPPDQSCRSYSQLCSVLEVVQGPDPPPEMTWHPNFVELLVQLRDLSERTLIRQATRAARTPGWGQMPTELRRKIQDSACLVLAPADHASSRYKRSVSDGSRQNCQRSSYSRNLDLHQVKMAMVQHARRTNSNDHHHIVSSVVVRKNIPSDRSNTVSRRSVPITGNKTNEKPVSASSQGRPKTWPAQVKSRYLEKRPNHTKQAIESQERNRQLDAPVPQRRVPPPVKGMFISSSDSSRNSSPAMKRSSNISSGNVKVADSTSRNRAASATLCSSSHANGARSLKESTDSIKRSVSVNVQNQSSSESSKTPPIMRKMKSTVATEVISHTLDIKQDDLKSQTASLSQSITMSNDSLATVSSSDDAQLTNSEKNLSTKSASASKHNSSQNSSVPHSHVNKKIEANSTRTPLSLANKKAPSSNIQRKTHVLTSKVTERNTSAPSSGLMSKRSVSHVAKSPNISGIGSRLAIPLRTSRSVSSVPDKAPKVYSPIESLSSKKTTSKDQARPNYSAPSSKRASTGSSTVTSSSLAGRAISSRGNKANVNESKNSICKNTEKLNGDSSVSEKKQPQPTVGPRSGTFLKDEPTILKTPVVEDK